MELFKYYLYKVPFQELNPMLAVRFAHGSVDMGCC